MIIKNKKMMTVLLIGFLCFTISALIGCKEKTQPENAINPESTEVTQQQMCPVMGGKINQEFYTEYQGKKVYFCCPGCEEKFLAEPEKYLDKLPQFKE